MSKSVPKKPRTISGTRNKDSKITDKPWVAHFLIAVTVLLAFYGSINENYNLDDEYIYNSLPKPEEGLGGALSVFGKTYNFSDYRPVTIFTFAIEQLFTGMQPQISHTINLLLYLILNLSIFHILSRFPVKAIRPIALMSVLLFSVHTSHTEVVCSIKNRDNILSMLFGIWSLHLFIRYYTSHRLAFLLSAILLLFLGILSKYDAIVFLLITLLTLLSFYERDKKKLVILTIGTLVMILMHNGLMESVIQSQETSYRNFASFTENPLYLNSGLLTRISQSIQTVSYYIKFMLIPKGYYYYFGFDMIPLKPLLSPDILLLLLIQLLIVGFAIYQYNKNRLMSYGILFFYLGISYCLNLIVTVAGIVSVRYSFIASLGFCIFAGTLLQVLSEKLKSNPVIQSQAIFNKITPKLLGILTGLLVLFYLASTLNRNKDWKDIFTLIRADIGGMKKSFQGNRIAATYLLFSASKEQDTSSRKLLLKQGLQYSLNARALYKKDAYVNELVGQAYYNLGNIPSAKAAFKDNLAVNDTSVVSLEFLGDIYFEREQKYDSAAILFKKITSIRPAYETPYFKYLNAGYRAGKKQEVFDYFRQQQERKSNGYIPAQCLAYYYFFEKDSTRGMEYMKASFEAGFRNPDVAKFTQQYFLLHDNKKDADYMNHFLPNGL